MPEELNDWDSRWLEPSPQMHTLKVKLTKITDDIAIMNTNTVHVDTYQSHIDNFNEQITIMNTNITLLQLFVLNKINASEMHNILKMYKSVDAENHEVAKATIAELIKSL